MQQKTLPLQAVIVFTVPSKLSDVQAIQGIALEQCVVGFNDDGTRAFVAPQPLKDVSATSAQWKAAMGALTTSALADKQAAEAERDEKVAAANAARDEAIAAAQAAASEAESTIAALKAEIEALKPVEVAE